MNDNSGAYGRLLSFVVACPGAASGCTTPLRRGQLQDITVGLDLIEIDRIAATLERFGARFVQRVYTEGEAAYCRGRAPQLAARFAAKEAVMKALGLGRRGIGWREVEVTRKRTGEPEIVLHGRAAARAATLGIDRIAVSLTHSRNYAAASVVGRLA